MGARPPYGLSLPIRNFTLIDGDTVEFSFISLQYRWRGRLIDCWCLEDETEGGKLAAKEAARLVAQSKADGEQLSIYIPMPDTVKKLFVGILASCNPLKGLTFDRIPLYVYLNDKATLNEKMVANGFATLKKPPKVSSKAATKIKKEKKVK